MFYTGTFLTLRWNRGGHGVRAVTKKDFDSCSLADYLAEYGGGRAPHQVTIPGPGGFSLNGQDTFTYYIICPADGGSHCYKGMKLMVHVKKQNCP